MRTTLDLNDDLLIRAKKRAASERRTLTSLVEEALRTQLSDRPRQAVVIPKIPVIRGGTPNPDIDFTSNKSLMGFDDDEKFR